MSVQLGPIQSPLATPVSTEPTAKDAGQQLEAFFMRRMLSEMRASVGKGMFDGGYAGKMFQDMLDEAMADEMSSAGNLGIADMVTRELEPNSRGASPVGGLLPRPGAYRANGTSLKGAPVTAPISSDFGTRVHPVTGKRSFHEGIDLAAPKGSDVSATGPGVVVRAGKAGNYGNIVVVDHGGGLETRYAHLNSMSVEVGQQVAAGDLLGEVGETGRVTGPHLHFEVRRGGKAIDPKGEINKFEESLNSTKELGNSVDR